MLTLSWYMGLWYLCFEITFWLFISTNLVEFKTNIRVRLDNVTEKMCPNMISTKGVENFFRSCEINNLFWLLYSVDAWFWRLGLKENFSRTEVYFHLWHWVVAPPPWSVNAGICTKTNVLISANWTALKLIYKRTWRSIP